MNFAIWGNFSRRLGISRIDPYLGHVPLARFFYGVAAGSGVGLLLMTLDGFEGWMSFVALVALALALGFHQKHRREMIGRRWRRSPSLFNR